ncbi:MAG: diguanylate cyclase [Acidobacteriota bacterium]
MRSEGQILLLLADEDEARRMRSSLAGQRLDLRMAHDGISGLALVSELTPDLVVCDRALPKMDGLEVCRLIKRNHRLKHLPVLLLLDETDDASLLTSLEVGANDYLQRPLNLDELETAVRCHLRNRTSINRLKDDNRELATILDIAEKLSSTLATDDLFQLLVEEVSAALTLDECSVVRWEDSTGTAMVEASRDTDQAEKQAADLEAFPELTRCAETGKMLYVEDVRRDGVLAEAHGDEEQLSLLCIPLHPRETDQRRAALRVARSGAALTYREIKFCQICSTMAGNALENARLYESLEHAHRALTEISRLDPLTDLYNRRHLFDRLQHELARCAEQAVPLSCLLIDLDHFKAINDQLGHQTGDRTLVRVARLLSGSLRGGDLVGRYGGEEFLVVLPRTGPDNAQELAERLRQRIETEQVPGALGSLTVSIGVASVDPSRPVSMDDLVGRADRALYEAKGLGRNRVACDDLETALTGPNRT